MQEEINEAIQETEENRKKAPVVYTYMDVYPTLEVSLYNMTGFTFKNSKQWSKWWQDNRESFERGEIPTPKEPMKPPPLRNRFGG